MADPHFDPTALPFPEATEYWRKKIKLPTSGYTDVWDKQHAVSFVVAGANEDRLVEDFYNAIDKARLEGGYEAFKASFNDIVKEHGWAHNGSPGWRSRLIYNTNVRQAWLAGKYQQQEKEKVLRPYRKYIHSGAEHYRPDHKSWDGIILPCDDPWWNTHMPQNGYNCGCDTDTLSRREAGIEWETRGKTGPDEAPEIIWEEKIVGKNTGNPRTVMTPQGIDPGFAYNPGKAYLEPWTVPPFDGHQAVLRERNIPFAANAAPPLPSPTHVTPDIARIEVKAPEEAVEQFLGHFGATLKEAKVFKDVAGNRLVIGRSLFVKGDDKLDGDFKWLASPEKLARLASINLLAMTIIDPDEIWEAWEEDRKWTAERPDAGKNWRLKRRYLKAFEVDGTGEYGIAAFEWGRDGWAGATAFMAQMSKDKDRLKYYNKQRVGRLIYKK
jgi:hypothetical protein